MVPRTLDHRGDVHSPCRMLKTTKFFTFYTIKLKTHALSTEVIGNRKEKQKVMDVMLIFTMETRRVIPQLHVPC